METKEVKYDYGYDDTREKWAISINGGMGFEFFDSEDDLLVFLRTGKRPEKPKVESTKNRKK